MEIGITYNLKNDFTRRAGDPEDRFEEYDSEVTVEAIAAALEAAGHQPRRLGGGRALIGGQLEGPPARGVKKPPGIRPPAPPGRV
jgi:hypothetical protein